MPDPPRIRRRINLTARPNLRELRLALFLSVDDAARVTREDRGLLQSQESAGSSADSGFVATTVQSYLEHAHALARPPADIVTPDVVRHAREGVGLPVDGAARLLGSSTITVASFERQDANASPEDRLRAWSSYLDWAWRQMHRDERAQPVRAARRQEREVVVARGAMDIEEQIRFYEAKRALRQFMDEAS